MKSPISIALVAGASLMLVASTSAHGPVKHHRSALVFDGMNTSEANSNREFIVGHVESPSAKCVANRTVKIFFSYENDPDSRLVDIAKSGRTGTFAGQGPARHNGEAVVLWQFVLKQRNVGSKHHRQVCDGSRTL
jgi:hypothetical protein